MAGKSTVSSISMPTKVKINMTVLRAVILTSFLLSVAVTVWSIRSMDGSMTHDNMMQDNMAFGNVLHVTHVILITLTFLLIALYLYKSAEIASLTIHRELRLRMTVDKSAEFVEFLPYGAPVLNACVGALAKHDVFVRHADSMTSLARQKKIAAKGNSPSREGYAITKSTLEKMGAELSENAEECPVDIVLGPFDQTDGTYPDFILMCDKVTHMLTTVYVSRIFIRYKLFGRILFICALVCAVVLCAFRQFTYAGAVLALWASSLVISVRRIERKTTKLSFKTVVNYCRKYSAQ